MGSKRNVEKYRLDTVFFNMAALALSCLPDAACDIKILECTWKAASKTVGSEQDPCESICSPASN
jgi:hypothetical protein